MRKTKEDAAETRRRIVETAAREFRENGIEGTGIAELMSAAGLTVGGFYRHFGSKEQLVAEALGAASQSMLDLRKKAIAKGGLKKLIDVYLSSQHRSDHGGGCLHATLGSELARTDGDARSIAAEALAETMDFLTEEFRKIDPSNARARATVTMSTFVGALTLSRITEGTQLSDAILRHCRGFLASLAEEEGD